MLYRNLILLFLLIANTILAQEKKSAEALYIQEPLTIDGNLDEEVYQKAQPAKDFLQIQPNNGKPSFQSSEVYIFYDQTAIYFGAMLYDSAPDSIFNYFSERDNIGMSDYFGIYIDPYNQGQLAYGFFITPAGVQTDMKAIKREFDYEDNNWNAVWESKTQITQDGWIVEMRIPYSALRFPDKEVHTWGLNMFRNIRRYNSNNSWNFIDRNVAGFIHQEGTLSGIKNIKPPVRLSFSPYLSTYIDQDYKKTFKGGMDMKYGISESFTLDMMVIPDFGQVQSDDKKLNLSPYELYYDEKRQFFTEGTELFQRGNIFYSRRIGASPKFSGRDKKDIEEDDFIPSETQLFNATKISGRTENGWGIGFLNAMSQPSYAKYKDTVTQKTREVLVQPFTNYNVSVVDKSLKNNSYISLINSNIWMDNDPFRANVTATEFQLRNKEKTYAITGKAGISNRGDTTKETGFYSRLAVEKNSGKFQFGIIQDVYSDKYNPNDLGYIMRNNQLMTESYIFYQIIEPFGIFREWNANLWWDYYRIYKPSSIFNHEAGFNTWALFKNNYSVSLNGGFGSDKYDYYEPRVKGRYFLEPHYYFYNINIRTDERKTVSFYFHRGGGDHPSAEQNENWGDITTNIRFSQRLLFFYGFSFRDVYNNIGYVDNTDNEDTIYFSKRNINSISNVIESSYAFTNAVSLKLRFRHYWSAVKHKEFYQLQQNGSLQKDNSFTNDNKNYNSYTTDIAFRWIFAPGSEMSIVWKGSVDLDESTLLSDYWNNLDKTLGSNKTNSLSFKILYYIDYNNIVKRRTKIT